MTRSSRVTRVGMRQSIMPVQHWLLLLTWCTATWLEFIAVGGNGTPGSVEMAVCAECWTKKALGPVREDAGGPHVTCEAVLVTAYWAALKVTDDINNPENLCVAVSWEPGGSERGLKCEVEVEEDLGGAKVGSSSFASVHISYAYNPLNLQEAPKVTLQGEICPTSLRDLPSQLSHDLRRGVGTATQPVQKGMGIIRKKARDFKGHFKNPFP